MGGDTVEVIGTSHQKEDANSLTSLSSSSSSSIRIIFRKIIATSSKHPSNKEDRKLAQRLGNIHVLLYLIS